MNRKGNVAFIMIILVALTLCVAAMYTFVSFSGKFETKSQEWSEMTSGAEFNYNYAVSEIKFFAREAIVNGKENYKTEFARLEGERRNDISWFEGIGNLLLKIENNDYKFEKKSEKKGDAESVFYTLEIKGLFVNSAGGASAISRNFDLSLKFGPSGNVVN